MSQFIRIKRQDHTYFMHVEPTDSFLSVKAKVAELNDRQNAGDVRIFNADRVRLLRSLVFMVVAGGRYSTSRDRYTPHSLPPCVSLPRSQKPAARARFDARG